LQSFLIHDDIWRLNKPPSWLLIFKAKKRFHEKRRVSCKTGGFNGEVVEDSSVLDFLALKMKEIKILRNSEKYSPVDKA
jgi:hypothetical protein